MEESANADSFHLYLQYLVRYQSTNHLYIPMDPHKYRS